MVTIVTAPRLLMHMYRSLGMPVEVFGGEEMEKKKHGGINGNIMSAL